MTGCEEIRPLISSYVDGEASAEEIALVQAHIKTCDKCQSHLAFLKLLGPAINHAPIAAPSPLLFERIAKATYAKPTWQQRYLAWLTPLSIRWTVGPGLVAAGIVAILVAPRVMQPTPTTTDTTPIAANRTTAPTPPSAVGTPKSVPAPTLSDVVRPSITPPTPAPIAIKPAEPRTNTHGEHAVTSESPAKRVAIVTKTATPAKKVEATNPAKSAPKFIASAPKLDTNVTPPPVKPSPLPTTPPKTTVEEPLEMVATANRDTTATSPSAAVSKSVAVAANVIKPETPSFNTSTATTAAAPDPDDGGGRRKSFQANLKGYNTERPAELANVSLRKPLVSNSSNLSIAESPVK